MGVVSKYIYAGLGEYPGLFEVPIVKVCSVSASAVECVVYYNPFNSFYGIFVSLLLQTKYQRLSNAFFVWTLLLVVVVLTCPVKKAIKVHQHIPLKSQSVTGGYVNCNFNQADERLVAGYETSQDILPVKNENHRYAAAIDDGSGVFFSSHGDGPFLQDVPLFLRFGNLRI